MGMVARLVVVAAVVVAPVAAAPVAWAAPAEGSYGEHVRHCAQQMGFSGEHNPGMHRGAAGWDGMACHHHG